MKSTKQLLPCITALILILSLMFTSCGSPDVTLKTKVSVLSTVSGDYTDNGFHVINKDNMIFVTQSGLIELYYDKTTGAVAVKETSEGKFWYSMPLASDDESESRAYVLSAVLSKDGKKYILNSQDNSVAFSSFEFKPVSNGLQVTYNMASDKDSAVNGPQGDTPYASVTVSYILSDGVMDVKVNCGDIKVSDGYALEKINLLSYFGAEKDFSEGDFILLPDGSGSLMMSDSKSDYPEKSFKVYGSDPAVKDVTENESKINASALLGFFGMKQQNSAFVALITKGDTIASVDSVQKSSGDKYDRAGTSYTITDVSYVGSGSKMTKYVGTQYSGEINVCYRFLTNKNASYSGMAIACREQLIRNSVLSTRTVTSSAHLPFALTILGTAQKSGGRYVSLTTFDQAYDLLNMLKAKSVNNITVRYCGVLDGANNQDLLSGASTIKKLGGKKSFENLKQYITTQKFEMYGDVSTVIFSTGENSDKSARDMSGKKLTVETPDKFSALSKKNTTESYALALSKIEKNITDYVNSTSDFAFDGYCVNDAGSLLYSDFSMIGQNRDTAVQTVSKGIEKLSNGHDLMICGGNFYLLKNADFVSGLSYDTAYPQSDSYYSVPFVEMILHGISDYTLTPVNLANDSETAFLKSLEYGAIPSYEWYCSKTGKAELDEKYSYENQLNSATEKYQTADSILGNLRNARMTAHYKVQDGVYCTEYNNSIIIYFNYNDTAVTVNSLTVEPKSAMRVN